MFPNVLLLCSFRPDKSRNKKKADGGKLEANAARDRHHRNMRFPVSVDSQSDQTPASMHRHRYEFSSRSAASARCFEDKSSSNINGPCNKKVSNVCDVIQRVVSSCLLRPLTSNWQEEYSDELPKSLADEYYGFEMAFDEYYKKEQILMGEDCDSLEDNDDSHSNNNKMMLWELRMLMHQTFDAVSAVKRAYMGLQEAHCTRDPERMRAADMAVVQELTGLGTLREHWRRMPRVPKNSMDGGCSNKMRRSASSGLGLPREPMLEGRLKCEAVKASYGKKGRSQSKRKVSCSQGLVATYPASELFESTICQVREASKSFTTLLLSNMRAAQWDIAAAVRSIEASAVASLSINAAHHAKYALESYFSRKMFQGFDHETFFMDRSLSSLLNSEKYRHDCFMQYRDMKTIDSFELLEVLPACNFSKFSSRKYLSIIHPKMEESFFGNLEQQRQVMAGKHPQTQFYREFLGFAKAVWLLHLLAFSLEPPPSLFEAERGAEFHPQYMESVVKLSMGQLHTAHMVGFPVFPGFKLGNGTLIKARVYLI